MDRSSDRSLRTGVYDMARDRTKSERRYSNKYAECLFQWEHSRRLKRPVTAPSKQDTSNMIHGVRVERKGRGCPPATGQEAEFRAAPRRLVEGASYACREGLLDMSQPLTSCASEPRLGLDGTRSRRLLRTAGSHNQSSLVGAGALMSTASPPEQHKPWRGRGEANPGHSEAMARTLAFSGEPEEDATPTTPRSPRRLLYTLAAQPSLHTIIRHRYSDPDSEPGPAKFEAQRTEHPATQPCALEESRLAFYASLQAYAANKVRGDYGTMRVGSLRCSQPTGLRMLAGLA